ncbi:MAG: transglycosylase SLT domain-containing protein [Magnetovibrio sp.]|nr:transglycosylase SLT domain-containing protein [Magnetovibrio sp.]
MTGNSTSKPRSRQGLLSIGGLFLAAAVALVATTSHAASPDDVRRMIVEEARETMVPASLAIAVAQVESGLRPDHQGADGARGVFQLLPETAEGLGLEPRQLWQPRTNIRAGLTVLDRLLDRTEGRWDEALKAFAGRRDNGRATNAGRYVTDVLG